MRAQSLVKFFFASILAWFAMVGSTVAAERMPLIDAHIHYSHDAWEQIPPKAAIKILRQAGLALAFVSSSSDEGTQMLYRLAPDLVVPVLRPYRRRGELASWFRDTTVVAMLSRRLAKNTYAGIGEFHISGADAEQPVMRKVIALAGKYGIFLHAHADAEAITRIFKQDPKARVLWAHSGFLGPRAITGMLRKFKYLWADLAFQSAQGQNGKVPADWRAMFEEFPDRFMLGTDTYVPGRWQDVVGQAAWSRRWLRDLPKPLASKIAHGNARRLVNWALKK